MDNTTFGVQLKKYRESRNLSQQELSDLLDTSKQVISRYETFQRIPKLSVVSQYAKKLGISLSYLLGDTDDPYADGKSDTQISPTKQALIDRIMTMDDSTLRWLLDTLDRI